MSEINLQQSIFETQFHSTDFFPNSQLEFCLAPQYPFCQIARLRFFRKYENSAGIWPVNASECKQQLLNSTEFSKTK